MDLMFLLVVMSGVSFCAGTKLGTYNVDASAVSVSGISSGGAMASQYHVAHSKHIMGVGIINGVMWGGGSGNLASATMAMSNPNVINLNLLEMELTTAGLLWNVDAPSNMGNDKIFIFDGSLDTIVSSAMGPRIELFYEHYVHSTSQIKTVLNIKAEHSMPTLHYGGSCDQINKPYYLNDCNYDAAFELLNHIYGGGLNRPDVNTAAKGELVKFDQSEFFSMSPLMYSMDTHGYVYIPSGCADQVTTSKCKLHIAFHGCQMGQSYIGDIYVRHGGYNEVAELNNIIILYPQVVATPPLNVKGCWDWFGYTGIYYATNKGFQVEGVRRMISRLIGNSGLIVG